jgi:hypothetical protein
VTSVRCRPPVEAAPGPADAVQAFKSMPAPAAGGGAYTVGLRIEDARVTAVIPYHLDPADPFGAPAADVPPAASCVETPTAPATAGQEVVITAPAARP